MGYQKNVKPFVDDYMKKTKRITLRKNEYILAIEPKYVSGPGWGNSPLWVHIVDSASRNFRSECLQPNEQTPEIHLLFQLVATGNAAMMSAIEKVIKRI